MSSTFDESRREQGLPAPPRLPSGRTTPGREQPARICATRSWCTSDAVIGTDATRSRSRPAHCREWAENGRRYFHYRTERRSPSGRPSSPRGTSARGPLERCRAPRLSPPDAHVQPRPHDARHEGRAGVLHGAVRSVPVPRAAHRGVPALRQLRARAPAHHRLLGGERLSHAGGGGRRGPALLRVAHETAHQWWGGQVRGAQVRGARC
jgi:ABC-2 type transport system permease protein